MNPWIPFAKEFPNERDIIENKLVYYDYRYRLLYINETPSYLTNEEPCIMHLCWMKKDDFIENCSEMQLNDN